MKTGLVQGGIDGIWVVAHDSGELTAPLSRYDIGGLNGDVDEEYRLIIRIVATDVGPDYLQLRFNNDSGSNYGNQRMWGLNAGTGASRYADSGMRIAEPQSTLAYGINFSDTLIYAKSGFVRTAITRDVRGITGTTVDSIWLRGTNWSNTTDNITLMTLMPYNANSLGIGSRFILLKKVNTSKMRTGLLNAKGKIVGAWQKIAETTLTAAATSLTFSGLDGDADVLYNVLVRSVNGSGLLCGFTFNLNGDSAVNYGSQHLVGINASVSASRTVGGSSLDIEWAGISAGALHHFSILLYAKSGYVRTAIVNTAENISGTTVDKTNLIGCSWNNTANAIQSLVLNASQANGIGIGTHIELWRLNL